ncbi:MAG: hypothetical protein FJ388_06490 [Verrucomicrobia bacterium]|nr:hypothetical protein [Verrucomicrobiota bacterium]
MEPPVGTTNQAELTVQSAPPAAKTVEPPVRATNQPAPTVQAAPPAAESAVVAAPVTVPEAQTQQFGSLTSQSIARQPDPVRAGDGVKPGLLETNQVQNVVSGESRVLEREQRATVHDTLPATNAATAMMAQAPATNTKPAVVSATNAPPAVALKPLDWRLVPAVYHTSMLCIMLEVYYRFAWRA